jgi:hypothetical protein
VTTLPDFVSNCWQFGIYAGNLLPIIFYDYMLASSEAGLHQTFNWIVLLTTTWLHKCRVFPFLFALVQVL